MSEGGHGFCLSAGASLYRKLKVYLMTEAQLQEHGYPRSNPEAPGRAVLHNLPEKKLASDRKCPRSTETRCCSRFRLTLAVFNSFQQNLLPMRRRIQGQRQRQLCEEGGV